MCQHLPNPLAFLAPSCTHWVVQDLASVSTESNFVFTNPELKPKHTNFQWSGDSAENTLSVCCYIFSRSMPCRENSQVYVGSLLSFRQKLALHLQIFLFFSLWSTKCWQSLRQRVHETVSLRPARHFLLLPLKMWHLLKFVC